MAVIGVGHLGKEHARILAGMPEVELVGVVDANPAQAEAIAMRCHTQAFADHRQLIRQVDAVSIVVPTSYHRSVASDFIRAGIPCMVEKPLAASLPEAEEMIDLASRHGVLVQVGHIERFNPVIIDLEKRCLRPKYIEAERLGVFSGRALDVGVVFDLMIHDLDVILSLVRSDVVSIQAVGVSLFGQHEDMANARLTFANGCIATVTAGRMSMKPTRRMRILGSEGMVCLDFAQRHSLIIQPSAKVRQQGLNPRTLDATGLARLKESLFGQEFELREFDLKEGDQLTMELLHFVKCVQTGTQPKVSGTDGLRAVRLATQIVDHLRRHAWEGPHSSSPCGPTHLPAAEGFLLRPEECLTIHRSEEKAA